MKNKIFSREFLRELEGKSKNINILNFLLNQLDMPFHEAILQIADHLNMEPKYFDIGAWEAKFVQLGHPEKKVSEFIRLGDAGKCEVKDAIPPGKVSNNSDAFTIQCELLKNLNFSNPSQDISRTEM